MRWSAQNVSERDFGILWQKESLGEYGSGWEWDSTWPKVFDYEKITNIDNRIYVSPMRYVNTVSTARPSINGAWVDYGTGISSKEDINSCPIDTTNGEILVSGSVMSLQQSCEPHSYNAGNYYNLPSQLGDAKYNSVCSRGWKLPESNSDTDYSNLLLSYGIDFNSENIISPYDAALLNFPLSLLRSGIYYYTGVMGSRDNTGYYRASSSRLSFHSNLLLPAYSVDAKYGFAVRCVSG